MKRSVSGFTIVELLIVIVVIAILAAISVVAYNGIQARAYNTSVISAARNTVNLINSYVATNSAYPSTTSELCATQVNTCSNNVGTNVTADNSALIASMTAIGAPVQSPPSGDAGGYRGIVYYYYSAGTYNGASVPSAYIFYVLKGMNSSCGLSKIANDVRITNTGVSSSTGYSWTNSTLTGCYAHINRS